METAWVVGYCTHNSTHNMRDKHYKVRHIRIDDKTWEEFKVKRKKTGLSWNRFIIELLKKK